MACDDNFTCVLDRGGDVHCMGTLAPFGAGLLGPTPVRIDGLPPLATIAAGRMHACGTTAEGVVHCWGVNGYASFAPPSAPTVGGFDLGSPVDDARQVAVGGLRGCAALRDGTLRCWGDDSRGSGDGFPSARFVPGLPPIDRVAAASGGCASGARDTWCWGANWWGQVGAGTQTVIEPSPVRTLDQPVRSMHRGGMGTRTCAATARGELWCWGEEMPTDGIDGPSAPIQVVASSAFTTVAAGVGHACAIDDLRRVWCWGENMAGALGDGTLADSPTPRLVALDEVVAITAGYHTCALRADRSVHCWGYGLGGALGAGAPQDNPAPVRVDVPPLVALAAAANFTCGLTASGDLVCWGDSDPAPRVRGRYPGATSLRANDQLACVLAGDGIECVAMRSGTLPRSIRLDGVVDLAVGDGFSGDTSCAVLRSGETWCSGPRELLGGGRVPHVPKIVTGRWRPEP